MLDEPILALRAALRSELHGREWRLTEPAPGPSSRVVAEFVSAAGGELLSAVSFDVARWRSTHRPGGPVTLSYRSPLTVSTVVLVRHPAATVLHKRLGGAAPAPVLRRFLGRVRTEATDPAAITAIARELAGAAQERAPDLIARYATIDAIIAEWQGTRAVDAGHEREWVPVLLVAAGRGPEALRALKGYTALAAPGSGGDAYRTYATSLTRHVRGAPSRTCHADLR